ncbi:Flp pilus assembly protein CpaB [uncultured Tyzzerella sp.]|uniref:Flp pilus assembly protein CpaB n=1 Tax=uncultured Tyzzerella sp. TaxID=2321398 RepID=UPI0029424CA7|nr:Flp pilus assembly protein CpaB [uncultured Tyzzerella sp.]
MKEKLRKLTKNKMAVGIFCVVTGLVVAFTSMNIKTGSNEVKNVVVTTKKIEVGDKITDDMLGYKKLSGDISGLITNKEEVLGKYAKTSMVSNDYITNDKLSIEAIYGSAYLENLGEDERAISVTITSSAKGLSGKLESGDIVSVILSRTDENRNKDTYIPEELKYVEIISVSDSKGLDTGSENENAEKLGSTVTLLTMEEQSLLLANAENLDEIHFQLVYRGNDERKQKLLNEQKKIIKGEPLEENANNNTSSDLSLKEKPTEPEENAIYINNNLLEFSGISYPSLKVDNNIFVPAKILFEKLGYQVYYDQAEKTIQLTNRDIVIKFSTIEDEYSFNKDEEPQKLGIAPYNYNGINYVPIKFLEKANLIYKVEDNSVLYIFTDKEKLEQSKEKNTKNKKGTVNNNSKSNKSK